MNTVILSGRLTKDTDLKTCNSGTEVCNFTVAVDRRVKKGEDKQADFIDCTAWGKSATFINNYFHKGDGISITGRIESRKYTDKDGHNRVAWGVTVEETEFPLGKNGTGNTVSQATDNSAPNFETLPEDDGDLPF